MITRLAVSASLCALTAGAAFAVERLSAPPTAPHRHPLRRRHGLRRSHDPEFRAENPHATPRPARARGTALHGYTQLVRHLHAEPLWAAHRSLSLAEIPQHCPDLRPAVLRRRAHASHNAAKTGLPHRLYRQMAPRLELGRSEPGELFDLSRDPAQRGNLFAKHPEKLPKLRALLADVRARG